MVLQLSSLYLYPLKSCAPLALTEAAVEPRGLAGDRRWMVVGPDGMFITGRLQPRLTLLRAQALPSRLLAQAPGMPPLELAVPPSDGERLNVRVWRSRVDALAAGAAADAWISRYLGLACRLVYMDQRAARPVDTDYGRPGDEVSFADGFPLLLISQASLDGLNRRLRAPVSMLRFRPNLVVAGSAAHAEDGWKRLRIGAIEFELPKRCSRCVFTTIDPGTAQRDPDGEPLRTLREYRRDGDEVMFGVNLIARGSGMLRVGDAVEVLA